MILDADFKEVDHSLNADFGVIFKVDKSVPDYSVVANALKGYASGSAVTLADISPLHHILKVVARSRNLIPYPYYYTSKIINGVTFTVNADGSVTIKGTATANCYFYLLIGKDFGETSMSALTNESATNGNYVVSKRVMYFAREKETYIYVTSGEVVDETLYPILAKGTMLPPWTPYINDLTTAKLNACGKNLIPFPYVNSTKTINGVTFTVNADGSITVNGTATAQAVFELQAKSGGNTVLLNGVTYNLSGSPSGCGYSTYFIEATNDKAWFADVGGGRAIDGTGEYFRTYIIVKSGVTVNNAVFYPQLEVGETKTDYEPYKEPTTYSVNADGAVEGVAPIYPTTTLIPTEGIVLDVEYNRDINKAFAELYAMISK